MTTSFSAWWEAVRLRYDALLVEERLRLDGRLGDVARYALAGGKRVRPLLAEAMGDTVGAPATAVCRVAVAVEYLHTASLLLDDLPAMDRARERRGTKTAHAQFSEADATLASTALVARGYAVLLGDGPDRPSRRDAVSCAVSDAIVAMAEGQSRELSLGAGATATEVELVHLGKTTALFVLLARLITIEADASADASTALAAFASAFGAAFQIVDDLEDRDVEGEERGNIVVAIGDAAARDRALARLREAREALAPFGSSASRLEQCVDWLSGSLAAVSPRS